MSIDPHEPYLQRASPAYRAAIFAARAHHAASKTYSGMFLRTHAVAIARLIAAHRVHSILDFGAGKGLQYAWRSHDDSTGVPAGQTLEQFWRIAVRKYDPCWPPFAEEPVGPYGLVICTHTLGSVPAEDLGWILDRIYGFAERAVYIAEKIGRVRKAVIAEPASFSRAEWIEALRRPSMAHLDVVLATRERRADGEVVIEGASL